MSVRSVVVAGVAGLAAMALLASVLVAWLAVIAGAGAGTASASIGAACDGGNLDASVPSELVPIFGDASERYRLGPDGPSILAGLTSVESGFGQNMGPSSAGAVGWTQFLPSTWARYGVDGDGDGRRDPLNAHDAINSSANYLRASGAPGDWRRALYAYNHAGWYVEMVLREARRLRVAGPAVPCTPAVAPVGARRTVGGGRIVAMPGFPGEAIDERIVRDVVWMVATFHVRVTDGYAVGGHEADGEHPLGLAVDLVPGTGGSWYEIDRLARWAEPEQGNPRPPFRWVGYDGDKNHGRGNHLHLSWNHAPAPSRRPPAAWVDVLSGDG